jgi:hypothetical protein
MIARSRPHGIRAFNPCSQEFHSPHARDTLGQFSTSTDTVPVSHSGIDTDNGGEFINEAVIAYCEQAHITFTRGRPNVKNDQCFVEQKNGLIVRQVVGYDRLVGEHAYRQLIELYRALRLYVNCFQPSMKLLSKQRDGKKCATSMIQPRPRCNDCSSQASCLHRSSKN